MLDLIDEIDSAIMESEIDVLLSMLSLYDKAMIISENYKPIENVDSLPFSIFQEYSIIMESKSESIFKKISRVIKETFKKIIESIKKIFKKSSKKEDITKIKDNAKSVVEDYNQHKDKSKIAKLAANAGLTVAAVMGGLALVGKNKNIIAEILDKQPKKNNNENEKDVVVCIPFDVEILEECNEFIKNELNSPDNNEQTHREHIQAIKDVTKLLQDYNESHKSSSVKTSDIEEFANDVDKIEKMYDDFDKVLNNKDNHESRVTTPFTAETDAELNKFYVQFEKYVSSTIESVKALRMLSSQISENDPNVKYFKTIQERIKSTIKRNPNPGEGNSTIVAYPYLYTKTFSIDFDDVIIPNIFPIDDRSDTFREAALSDTRGLGRLYDKIIETVELVSFNGEDYCVMVFSFEPLHHINKFYGKAEMIKSGHQYVHEYFQDKQGRPIYACAGYIAKLDDIKRNGIPVINHKMCFDIYIGYQKNHYYDTFLSGHRVSSESVKLKAIK